MKTITNNAIKILIMAFVIFIGTSATSNTNTILIKKDSKEKNDTLSYNKYKGKLLNKKTNEALVFASIKVEGENTATISNSEGKFTLKINKKSKAKNIIISHIGYKNFVYPITGLVHKRNVLYLEEAVISLDEILITPDYPELIVRKMLSKIKDNYPQIPNNMTGFYRESIQKGSSYVSLSEAIVKIYKPAYKGFMNDQVQIFKGRKGVNVKKMDTLIFKLEGGPKTTLLLDIIKHKNIFSFETISNYEFEIINEIKINDRLNYVIEFDQKYITETPLYSGRLFIDTETLALSAADFSLNLKYPDKATELFVRKIPMGVKATPVRANYSIRYREQNGKWYFSYAKGEVKFKVKWKRKLFANHYTTMLEIAITDRSDKNVNKIKFNKRFKSSEIFSELVNAFHKKDYWEKYNYIEPDQSIEIAIRKFNKLLKK